MPTKSKKSQNTFLKLAVGSLISFALFLNFRPKTILNQTPINSSRLANSEYAGLAKLLEAQSMHETGNYTSPVFKNLNNLFGMKIPVIRHRVNYGNNGTYSAYTDLDQSIEDQILYLRHVGFPTKIDGPEQFVRELKLRRYFTDDESAYLKGVKFFYNKL